MKKTRRLLSGNEAIALGAYHAGIRVAAAYPGTPSTEILENLARFKDIYAEWSTNEKAAELAIHMSAGGLQSLTLPAIPLDKLIEQLKKKPPVF